MFSDPGQKDPIVIRVGKVDTDKLDWLKRKAGEDGGLSVYCGTALEGESRDLTIKRILQEGGLNGRWVSTARWPTLVEAGLPPVREEPPANHHFVAMSEDDLERTVARFVRCFDEVRRMPQ